MANRRRAGAADGNEENGMSKIAIVGVEGSGKTVFMAALGEMYGQMSNDSLYLMPENQAAFAYKPSLGSALSVIMDVTENTARADCCIRSVFL